MATSKTRAEKRAHLRQIYQLKQLSGYGQPNNNYREVQGGSPSVNPFMQPKLSGLNLVTKSFPSNYNQTWDITAVRQATEQARRQSYPIQLAALYTWVYQSSPFVQYLIREIEVNIENAPLFLSDKKGNRNEIWTNEICKKGWFNKLRKEITNTWFWGFSGFNLDLLNGNIYKYPMQDIDFQNRFLRASTYNIYDGLSFDKTPNLLFVQPSTNIENMLGWLEVISRSFVQINQNKNNWVAAGKKNAYPMAKVSYPDEGSEQDENGIVINSLRAQAEDIAANMDPQNAIVGPYTLNDKGEPIEQIKVDFTNGAQGTGGAHRIYKDFNEDEKNELMQMIMLSTLTSSVGSKGSLALGSTHLEKYELAIQSLITWHVEELNNNFLKKLKLFYKNFPDDLTFQVNVSKQWDLEEAEKLSKIMVENGYRLKPDFFVDMGIPADYIIEKTEIIEQPTKEPLQLSEKRKLFFLNNKALKIGREYINLSSSTTVPISNYSKIIDEQVKFAYENQTEMIFEPYYSAQNKMYFDALQKNISINFAFENNKDTSFFEQYMTNIINFSSARSLAHMRFLQQEIYDKNGVAREFEEYKEIVKPINDKFSQWLRVEYEQATRSAVMIEQWNDIYKDRDIYPYFIYQTRDDNRVREEHRALDGKIFKIDDAKAQGFYPPNGWNCRCTVEATDKGTPLSDKEMDKLKKEVSEGFYGNVATDGIFPKTASFYDVLNKSKESSSNLFLEIKKDNYIELNTNYYNNYQVELAIKDWSNKENVIFKNKEWLLNILLTKESIENIGKKTRGFENIKNTVENPNEIWALWINEEEKKGTHLKFITFDKKNAYVVETKNGIIADAYLTKRDNKRVGLKLVK